MAGEQMLDSVIFELDYHSLTCRHTRTESEDYFDYVSCMARHPANLHILPHLRANFSISTSCQGTVVPSTTVVVAVSITMSGPNGINKGPVGRR